MSAHTSRLARAIGALAVLTSAGCSEATKPEPVASVTISPFAPSVVVGSTTQLTATTRGADGAELTGRTVTWSSGGTSIATVSSTGLVTGVAVGNATITATSEGQSGTVNLAVTPIPVATVTVTPASSSISAGQTVQLTATMRDANGNALTGRTVTWSTSNSSVATVSSTGLVSGSSAGTATITATSEGRSGTAQVTVTAQTASYEYYRRGGTNTPLTATLTIPGGGQPATLSIDGTTIAVTTQTSGSRITCMVGASGSAITQCASHSSDPHTMRLCGPDASGATVLKYVLFPTPDANRVPATASALLAAVQSHTNFLGIGVYPACGITFSTSWIRNAPNTNYYYWPDVFTTYSPAHVAGLLSGAVIYSTPNAGNNYNQYVAVRVGAGVFEVWH